MLLCGLQTIQITSNSKCYSTFVITYIPETCSLCFLICSCSSKGAELCNKTSRLYAENAVKVSDTRYLHIYACMSSFKSYEMWLILGRWSQLSCTQVMKCPFLLLWNACCISSYSVRQENGFMLSDHSASMTSAFSEEVCMPVFKSLYTSNSVFLSVFNFDISNTNHYNFFSYYGFCDLNVKSGVIRFYRSECCYPFYFLALETVSCCWFSRWQSSLWVSSAADLQQMLE